MRLDFETGQDACIDLLILHDRVLSVRNQEDWEEFLNCRGRLRGRFKMAAARVMRAFKKHHRWIKRHCSCSSWRHEWAQAACRAEIELLDRDADRCIFIPGNNRRNRFRVQQLIRDVESTLREITRILCIVREAPIVATCLVHRFEDECH